MSTYVIGDLQGCLAPLKSLLKKIDYNPASDQLWFTGDLINRGPQSLETLKFVYQLPNTTVVLGNHDLTLIAAYYKHISPSAKDNYQEILAAPEAEELVEWLCQKPLLHHDITHRAVLVHAGIYPLWDLTKAQSLAHEAESVLKHDRQSFLKHMYGNEPNMWNDRLTGWDRIRFIINAFTRMRFCHKVGSLIFDNKGTLDNAPDESHPWFSFPKRIELTERLVFGHWAALGGKCHAKQIFAVDSGCVWGNALTAMCLETETVTQVSCQENNK